MAEFPITIAPMLWAPFDTACAARHAVETDLGRFPAGYRYEVRRCRDAGGGECYRIGVFLDENVDEHGPFLGWVGRP